MAQNQRAETEYKQPPVVDNAEGKPRTIGIELEFSGISLADTEQLVLEVLDGETVEETAAARTIKTSLGEFKVELDWDYLKRKAKEEGEDADGLPDDSWVKHLSKAAAWLVPVEIVCPPIEFRHLQQLDPLIRALQQSDAKGTSESMIAAYGTHINPEIPKLDAPTLHAYLQAYSLLQWWLVEAHHVNNTRKLSPFIDLYPEEYVIEILKQDNPDMDQLLDDYLEFNPSRNRALDMLPLLCEIDEDRVRSVVDDKKIKSRPTFHYRLPDCRIGDPDWSLAREWNIWWQVEKLAYDHDKRTELCEKFISAKRPLIGVSRNRWVEEITTWLDQE
ncbi:hypothetical protein IDSA_09300 [Pseudidiomarina salinarum]|uniref:Amidoligase enzyme n=1 Tax=Pseudidiomarina salinarum TaxID=435908 RepID=A0A094L7G4_9GAMM|nr:amidoligase family protein [Pseudidiomarina salinarum]KFZ30708.1 hypothetical protein IDSA_09300 [Pseudidiomarina salinarum]RUO69227.1 hypothetical protein CWI79_09995 [Pseudidiomarina salinarum]